MRKVVATEYITLGSGKRLFEDGIDTKVLKCVDTKTFNTGIVILTYEPTKK